MTLPTNEYTFNLDVKGDKTKKRYEGEFTVKCLLTVQEQVEVGLRLDRYNGGSTTLPAGIARMNRALAEMEVRLVKAPSWWTDSDEGRTLRDSNIVFEVFLKALDAEEDFDKRMAKASEEAEKATDEVVKESKKSAKG